MNKNKILIDSSNSNILLKPSVKLTEDFIEKIRKMNAGKPDFKTYTKRVKETFGLRSNPITIDETRKTFLAGFIEGEGSISIAVKKNLDARFGVELDPLFNITQHINGVNHLYVALEVFQTGRIRYKAGSNATLVFIIEPRKSLQQKVCPFIEKYVYPMSSPAKQIRYENFKRMLDLFDADAHLDRKKLVDELLPIWDSMRVQQGYKGQTFKTLQEAQDFVKNYNTIH
jgi:hypothetical protein